MRWHKTSHGEVLAVCEKCGRAYDMASEWDRANLEWHICQKQVAR